MMVSSIVIYSDYMEASMTTRQPTQQQIEDSIRDNHAFHERVVSLEVRIQDNADEINVLRSQVAVLREVVEQAKGARWAIVGMASVIGFVLSTGAFILLSLFGGANP
jgi:hypothetical protein